MAVSRSLKIGRGLYRPVSKLSSTFEKTFGWTARRVVPEEQRRVKRGE